ncbi:MAG TPA: hypothetical protein VGB53_14405 [Rubricoccaceae bacterium]|jgi:hypothetical protein
MDDLKARIAALAANDYAAFRAWFFVHLGYAPGWDEPKRPARPAADYEGFDAQAYDDETDALRRVELDHWTDDLRSLRTEAQVLAQEDAAAAAAARAGRGEYTVFLELYEAEHPRPGYRDTPEAKAEWEWAHLDAYYEQMERLDALARHRIQKGAYIARQTELHCPWGAPATEPLDPPPGAELDAEPGGEPDAETWPPADPDEDLRQFLDASDPEDVENQMRARAASPAYARADDLYCAADGWLMAMPHPAPDGWDEVYETVSEAALALRSAAEASRRPGAIAATLVQIRRALPRADEARLAVDEARTEPWMTPAAHHHLTSLILAARDALQDHQDRVRTEYEALWDVARRVLSGPPTELPGAELPGAESDTLAEATARVGALAPEDAEDFRRWFLVFAGNHDGHVRMAQVRHDAAAFETFDPAAYDDEREALDRVIHERWRNDLRSLKTIAQELAREKQAARPTPPSGYAVFKAAYAADHPEPGADDPPEAHAEWKWSHLDAYYERVGSLDALAEHRIQKGAYIARHTEIHRKAQEWARGLFGPSDGIPRSPRVKGQDLWPPINPEDDLYDHGDLDDPDEGPDVRHRRATNPAFARSHDLYCATLGWMVSLPLPRPDDWLDTYRPVKDAATKMMWASETSFRPADIAATILTTERALPLADDALLALDEGADLAWLTPRALDHLTMLVVAAREALLDRLVEAEAHYEALWDVARRVLGSAEDAG